MGRGSSRPDSLRQLAIELAGARDELIRCGASLQLIPQNATKWVRFERLLEVASSMEHGADPKSVSQRHLRRLLTSPPIATPQVISGEDPFEEPFVTTISFYGGSYRVVSGGATSAHVGCQVLLEAVRGLPDEDYEEYKFVTFHDASVLLSLSEAVCERAGLDRWALPVHSPRKPLIVPPEPELQRLGRALTFPPRELEQLLGSGALDSVRPLIAPGRLEIANHEQESPTDDRIYLYPLVETTEGDVLVALPSGIAASITHRARARAVEQGIVEALLATLHEAHLRSLARAFRRMRWTPVQGPSDLRALNHVTAAFYRFDLDKLALVVSVVDPLVGYTAGRPFESADFQAIQEELHERFAEVRAAAYRASDDVSVLHVVSNVPLGRAHFIGFTDEATDDRSVLLAASLDDLDLMARIEAPDPLGLWKFASASDRLHAHVQVMSFSKLDEYAIYRQHGNSFYMSDGPKPTFISISAGSGGELRTAERRRIDQHAVVLPEGGRVVDVCRWPADDASPVYRPDDERFHAYHLVELTLPCWVVPAPEAPEETEISGDFAEATAFWLWKCESAVAAPLAELKSRLKTLQVRVRVLPQAADSGQGNIELEPLDNWVRCEVSPDEGLVSLTLLDHAAARLVGPENRGEREIAVVLAEAIHRMAGLPDDGIRGWMDAHVQVGPMKMFQVLGAADDLLLALGHTAQPRRVPDADVEQLLDEIGEVAKTDLALPTGPIPESKRTHVLNSLVGHLFARLMEQMASLNPEGILELLVAEREAILFMEARSKLQLPSQATCFGDSSSAVRKSFQTARDLTTTAIANRFLIECVSARPPSGDRRLSRGLFDRLLAIANQIVLYGYMSDAIRYELSWSQMSMLPSGRIGFDHEEPYHEALEAFRSVISRRSLSDAQRAYASHWADPEYHAHPFDSSALDEAFLSEFGISATEMSLLSGDLMEIGRSAPRQVASQMLDTLVRDLATSLDWPGHKVRGALSLLSLEELSEFPPASNRTDSYPWRFGRNRSAARRPLVVRRHPTGGLEVVWGPRAVYRAGGYLLDLVQSGRLKATTPRMKRYITTTRQQGNDDFKREVADFCRSLGYSDVRENVTRFGRLRLTRRNGEDIGDIDVLVIDRSNKVMLAIEVKDFEFARTPFELSNEIAKLLEGRHSAAHHHHERLTFLRGHLGEILTELGDPGPPEGWQVRGQIVTSADLFAAQFPKAQRLGHHLSITSFDALQARSAATLTGRRPEQGARRKGKRRRKRRKRSQ